MSELAAAIEDFLGDRARRNDSPHTLRNYGADLREFLEYFSPPGTEPPALAAIDLLSLREWLAHLYGRDQKPATIRRKLASLRALFRFLSREHRIERDPARLLRLPKMPKTLPDVPNTEVTNALVDGTSREDLERPFPARDRLLLELLYGCGLRISEAVGLNLEDFDRRERWVRVRGKGRKERQVPYGSKSAEALDSYLDVAAIGNGAARALFESSRRSPDRSRRAQHRQVLCDVRCGRFFHPSAYAAPRVRDGPAQPRRGPAGDSGTAGPRAALNDAEVHAGVADGPDAGLRQRAPEGEVISLKSQRLQKIDIHIAAREHHAGALDSKR